jgi:hypothetical protein
MKKAFQAIPLGIVLLSLVLVSCTSIGEVIDTVENADEMEFFIKISGINTEDEAYTYTEVDPVNVTPGLYRLIEEAVHQTEGSFRIGSIYRAVLNYNGVKYTLYMMDTATKTPLPITTPSGRQFTVQLGENACKWALYSMSAN